MSSSWGQHLCGAQWAKGALDKVVFALGVHPLEEPESLGSRTGRWPGGQACAQRAVPGA